MKKAHHQYGVGYAVWTCDIISTEEGVQQRTTKTAQEVLGGCIYLGTMIFYRQSYHNPDFILMWLKLDVAAIPLGC